MTSGDDKEPLIVNRSVEPMGDESKSSGGGDEVINVKSEPPRVLTFWSLFAIAYFLVSGGPYGIESAVSGAPNLLIFLLFIFLPFLWSYPLGMITAELSNVFNKNGGCSVWVEEAFGESPSLSIGLFSFFANMIDLSLYPVLFVSYYGNCFIGTRYENSEWGGAVQDFTLPSWLLAFLVILLIVACNIYGAEQVGVSANILAIILLLPFVLVVAIGIWHVDFKFLLEGRSHEYKEISIATTLIPVIWSFSGYDSMGQLAGEVKNSEKNYPRGVMAVLIVSIVTYILPMIVGMQYVQDWDNWVAGEFSVVAYKVGGIWLNVIMGVGGMASSLGLFNCCLCTVSRNLYSLGERGYLPSVYSRLTPKRGTPYVAIITIAIIIGILVLLPFTTILNLDMSVYSIVVLFEIAAYFKLFLKRQDLHRPFKAIKTKWGLPLIAAPGVFAILVLYSTRWQDQLRTLGVVIINLAIVGFRFIYVKYDLKQKTKHWFNNNIKNTQSKSENQSLINDDNDNTSDTD